MKKVTPKVFLIAQTKINEANILRYLESIAINDWNTDAKSDGEYLCEFMGRLCYRSWAPYDSKNNEGTNPNVGRVREGNHRYLSNIINSGHGSVLEHVNMSFIIKDCSRVLTHELIRHRSGCAYSQESLRYVRLEDLRFWIPDSAKSVESGEIQTFWYETLNYLESIQQKLARLYDIEGKSDFATKKLLTSMFRRLAPIGLATTIGFTANVRALRHMIELRTGEHAEEEIQKVFGDIAEICKREYPSLFFDMEEDNGTYTFKNSKI